MKGLILAAGAAKRLRPLTHTGAKHLVPIANRPVLFYVIDTMTSAGVRDIGLVVSPDTAAELRSAVGDGSAWGARVTYLEQRRPAGVAHAVGVAREQLGGDDFCVMLGDNIVGMPIREAVDTFSSSPDLAASIMVKEVADPSAFGVAELDGAGRVVRLIEKPKVPPSNLALVGIFLFRRSIFDAIDRIEPSARGELELTDAINLLIASGGNVRCEKLTSWWLDTGKMEDILLANDTVLDTWLTHDIRGTVDRESKLTGRMRIEGGASIVRSSIRGPVVIGSGAKIVDSAIGPFTSIGDGVIIERSGIEHSVILEGSRMEGVPRLEDSLVGRRVVVCGGGGDALSLFVGDDCRVELSRSRRARVTS